MHVQDDYKLTELGELPDGWEVKSFGNMFKLSSGNALTQREISLGKYPVYGGNGINGYHNQFMFEIPQISIGRVGAKCGCIHVTEPKSWITDNALYISSKLLPYCDDYLVRQLENVNLNNYANHNAQPVISGTKIYPILIPFPPIPEQQKIADILSTVDEHISETESLIEKTKVLKQGMMQRLLTKGIGHTEFKDTEIGRIPVEWEVVTLGSFSERISERNNDYNYPVLTISSLSGFIDQKDRWSYEQAGESLKKYTVLSKGSFSYNKGNSKTYKCGCTFMLKDYDVALVPNVYISFRTNQNLSEYLQYYFLSGITDSYLTTVITSTARGNGLLNIDIKDFFNSPIAIPPISEQSQIARSLSSIDDQIDSYKTKLTSLTKLKSALMQQLLTGKTRVKI